MLALGTIQLTALDGVTFPFEAGTACLELAYTGGEGDMAAYETLHTPADLTAWLRARLGDAVVPATGDDLDRARALRVALWDCADAVADGTPVPPAAVAVINTLAAHPDPVPALDGDLRRAWRAPVPVAAVLSALARDAVELLGGPLAGRIRRCAAADCPLVFVDTSRPGRRRWCSMQRCGNRAKVTAFRNRRSREEPT
jgi:predicted RNA-binding Zn ribbon-like protein